MKLKTEQQTRGEILGLLQDLKTPRRIRRTLTVWIREQKELLQEYKDALARDMNARYYLGEFITTGHVRNAEAELRILENLRADISPVLQISDDYVDQV